MPIGEAASASDGGAILHRAILIYVCLNKIDLSRLSEMTGTLVVIARRAMYVQCRWGCWLFAKSKWGLDLKGDRFRGKSILSFSCKRERERQRLPDKGRVLGSRCRWCGGPSSDSGTYIYISYLAMELSYARC